MRIRLLLSAGRVVGVVFLVLIFVGGTAEAAPCSVPSLSHPTIQSAVNDPACNPINVAPGLYPENVTIGRTVTLRGAQAGNHFGGRTFGSPAESTVFAAMSSQAAFTVQASLVTIDGFSVTNPNGGLGVLVKTAGDDAVITNNIVDTVGSSIFSFNTVGIYLELGPDRVRVVRNWIRNIQSGVRTAQGILVGDSTSGNPSLNILLAGNLIEDITSAMRGTYGIQVNNGASTAPTATGYTTVAIFGNTIRRLTGNWAHAIGLEGDTPNVLVLGNSISDLVDVTPDPTFGQDAVAVFFEANPSFSSGHVNQNNFNVTNLVVYGIALHPTLSAAFPSLIVDGTCNWWNASDGPGPTGPGSGAKVSSNVDYDPWLDAPAPRGRCGRRDGDDEDDEDEDDDDFDEDGERDDEDEDDDNDGKHDEEDEDDDNDGHHDTEDEDADNDNLHDDVDSQSTHQFQRSSTATLAPGEYADYTIVGNGSTLPMFGLVESPDALFLSVQIYDPDGWLVGASALTPGRALATAPSLLAGTYTVRVRNTGDAAITYTVRLITSALW